MNIRHAVKSVMSHRTYPNVLTIVYEVSKKAHISPPTCLLKARSMRSAVSIELRLVTDRHQATANTAPVVCLLPLLCRSLPIFDQLCIRSLNFVQRCLYHDSDVAKFISDCCIKYMVVTILVLVRM